MIFNNHLKLTNILINLNMQKLYKQKPFQFIYPLKYIYYLLFMLVFLFLFYFFFLIMQLSNYITP